LSAWYSPLWRTPTPLVHTDSSWSRSFARKSPCGSLSKLTTPHPSLLLFGVAGTTGTTGARTAGEERRYTAIFMPPHRSTASVRSCSLFLAGRAFLSLPVLGPPKFLYLAVDAPPGDLAASRPLAGRYRLRHHMGHARCDHASGMHGPCMSFLDLGRDPVTGPQAKIIPLLFIGFSFFLGFFSV
jgi:hypothetical protein